MLILPKVICAELYIKMIIAYEIHVVYYIDKPVKCNTCISDIRMLDISKAQFKK